MGGVAAGAAVVVPRRVLGGPGEKAPSETLNIACIGVGGKGASDVRGVSSENIVALCDVDEARAAGTFKRFPKAKRYRDFRRMLDGMDKTIDAVTVSTADHMHYPASMMAMKKGKHVFCQKPLAREVWEARRMAKAAEDTGVATVMGIQAHAWEGPRLLCEWLAAGAIGPVREVRFWTNRPIWPQGIDRPTDTPPVPKTLDWDLWLGRAPVRPYHPAYVPFKWRGWWDFGCGALGDIGCHLFDASFWALKLGHPTSVEAEVSGVHEETAPKWSVVTYQFPARGTLPPVKVSWYDGGKRPPRPPELEKSRKVRGEYGVYILGDKGTIMDNSYGCKSPRIIPETKMKAFLENRPPRTIPRAEGGDHYREWIKACKGGPACGADFRFSGPLTEMVLMGNLAVRTGKRVEWDGEKMEVTNLPELNRHIRTEARKGWAF
jgi:predicted dehydrogenase